MNNVNEIVQLLEEIAADQLVSKRLKEKISEIITLLNNQQDLCVEKAIQELEGLNGIDIPSYNRTQLWDVVSMLERSNH